MPPPGEEVCLFLGQMEFHVLIAGGRTEQLIPQFGRSWFGASGTTVSPLSALSRLTDSSDRRDGWLGKPGSHALPGGGAAPRLLPRRAEVEVIANSSDQKPVPVPSSSSSRPPDAGGEQILRQGPAPDKPRPLTVAAGQHKGQPASSESLKVTDQRRGIMKGSNLALALTFFTLGAASSYQDPDLGEGEGQPEGPPP